MYIVFGNLIGESDVLVVDLEMVFEEVLWDYFGFDVLVIVCLGDCWFELVGESVFFEVVVDCLKLLYVGVLKEMLIVGVCLVFEEKVVDGECVVLFVDGLWIDYVDGVGWFKLIFVVFD